jgi:hypothetical protein
MSLDDTDRGLYEKYDVIKNGEPVDSAFVLEPESDPAAREAILAYAEAVEDEALSEDLLLWINRYLQPDTDNLDGGEP